MGPNATQKATAEDISISAATTEAKRLKKKKRPKHHSSVLQMRFLECVDHITEKYHEKQWTQDMNFRIEIVMYLS